MYSLVKFKIFYSIAAYESLAYKKSQELQNKRLKEDEKYLKLQITFSTHTIPHVTRHTLSFYWSTLDFFKQLVYKQLYSIL